MDQNEKAPLPTSDATNAYDLLSDIVKLILEEPKRYNQHNWINIKDGVGGKYDDRAYPACGTIGCVAGWTIALTQPRILKGLKGYFETYTIFNGGAMKLLGLTQSQANELFDGDAAGRGPNTLYSYSPSTPEQHAAKGAEHIRAFQKKYATQLRAKQLYQD